MGQLVKVKHDVVEGNDLGFVMMDSDDLQDHHEILYDYVRPTADPFEALFQDAIRVHTTVGAFSEEDQQRFVERFRAWVEENEPERVGFMGVREPAQPPEPVAAGKAQEKAPKAQATPPSPSADGAKEEIPAGGQQAPGWVKPEEEAK